MSDPESRSDKSDAADIDETFLGRWSRRKQAAQRRGDENAEEAASAEPAERDSESYGDQAGAPEPPAVRETQAVDEASDSEAPGDEDMPPLETIDKGGSIAAFFSPNVSAGLRKAAMRRLFSQPQFGAVDMLDDYAKDYTNRAPLGNVVTADMRYRAEQAAKRLARKAAESLEPESTEQAAGIDERLDKPTVDPDSAMASQSDVEQLQPREPAGKQSTPEEDTTEDEDDQRPA